MNFNFWKILWISILFLLFVTKSYAQFDYNIQSALKNSSGHKVYLFKNWSGHSAAINIPIDSTISGNDTFSFHGKFSDFNLYAFKIDSIKETFVFIIDTGKIVIQGDVFNLYKATVAGSTQNAWKKKLRLISSPFVIKRNNTVDSIMRYSDDTIKYAQLLELYNSITNEWVDSLSQFIIEHPNSYAAFQQLLSIGDNEYEKIYQRKIFPMFSERIKNSEEGKQLDYVLFKYDTSTIINNPFPIIHAFDIDKKKIDFALNKENIYLIDYWASWCIPCVEKLPALKELYAKHKNKGFKIISLSIDQDYDAWIKALKKHQILWENYCGLNGDKTDDAKYFNLRGIPYTILVGKGNKIIKLNPTDEEVDTYLKGQ